MKTSAFDDLAQTGPERLSVVKSVALESDFVGTESLGGEESSFNGVKNVRSLYDGHSVEKVIRISFDPKLEDRKSFLSNLNKSLKKY